MSGNRRLAALITLSAEHPEVDSYRYLHAFIIPGQGVSPADRWRLEMSAQMGQGRLLREYDAVERLIKIREGIRLLRDTNRFDSEEDAIRVVANDFGTDAATIRKDLDSLKHIDNYLNAIGRPSEYWLANDLTEVFTEFAPLEKAMNANGTPVGNRAKLRTALYYVIRNGAADFRLLRDVRGAVGPTVKKKGAQSVPQAIESFVSNAPEPDLLLDIPNEETNGAAEALVDQFKAEYQAGRPGNLLSKAQRGEANIRAVNEALSSSPVPSGPAGRELKDSLETTGGYVSESLGRL